MCGGVGSMAMQITQQVMQTTGDIIGASGNYSSSKYNAELEKISANQADASANDAINRGNQDASIARSEAKRLMSAQEVALAENGADLSSGSALSLLSDTASQGEFDARTTLTNSLREAYGLRNQAEGHRANAQKIKQEGRNQLFSSLLTTASSAFGQYNPSNQQSSQSTVGKNSKKGSLGSLSKTSGRKG